MVWEGHGVRGSEVVAALEANGLKESVGDSRDGEEPAPRSQLRASSLTLIVFAPDPRARASAGRTVARMEGRPPARVILVAPDPDASETGIDARLRVQAQARADAPVVRYEEVTLSMRRVASRHLASLVGALVVGELPVFLWHMGVLPWGSSWQGAWSESVDRLIVDSAATKAPLDDLEALASFASARATVAVGDLAFARLRPWRLGLAEVFQPAARRAGLARVEGVEIAYPVAADAPSPPGPGALLLGGWLATRLGWGRARAGGTDYAVCERQGGDGRLVFSPVGVGAGDALRDSGVVAVTVYLRGPSEGHPVVLSLEPALGGLAYVDGASGEEGTIAVPMVDDADALTQNLELAPDSVYAESLGRGAELSRALRRAIEAGADGSDPDSWS